MVLAAHQFTVTDAQGNIVPGATITVRREIGGAPLADIYEDRDGNTPLSNPFQADEGGNVLFFASGGAYRIDATSGSFSATRRYVPIGTKQEEDSDPFQVEFPPTPNVQTFTSSGTYTPTEGMTWCRIRVQAPGGGSGGSDGAFMSGAGGGGGEYAEGFFTAEQIGASQSVTIGAAGTAGSTSGGNGGTGGTTSVGSLISCIGGGGGQGTGSNSTNDVPRAGGAGGTGGSGGHLRIPGQRGHSPAVTYNFEGDYHFTAHLGHGGDAFMGRGAVIPNAIMYEGVSNQPAVAGNNYGGGASGGMSISNSGITGALGGAAIVIIEEYFDLQGILSDG